MLSHRLVLAVAAVVANVTPALAQDSPELRVPIEHWGCSNCHLPDESNAHRIGQRPGPDLADVGSRVSREWLKRWIGNPASIRRAPTMPRLFDESDQDQADLDALVGWMSTLGEVEGGEVAGEEAVLAAGRELYHQVGCVNCHGALDSPAVVLGDEMFSKEVPRAFVFSSFGDLKGKWYPRALSKFLRDPGAVHRDGRMPKMNLNESESDLLATYLLSKWGAARRVPASRLNAPARGQQVFFERGCQACHVVGEMQFPDFPAPSLAQLDGKDGKQACLSSEEWSGPRYDFPAAPLALMFVRGLVLANHARVEDRKLDYLERQSSRLNCRACHEYDGQGGIPQDLRIYCNSLDEHADLGDEGRFPPHLDGVGAKLSTSWFNEVLNEGGAARPYLATRMPQYGEAVHDFAELFAHKAGVDPNSDATWPEATDERVLAGRNLMGMQTGACVSCHSFGDYPPVGTPGPDMRHFAERLRYDWWKDYIRDPEAFKPGTRMPSFMNDGKSVWSEPYHGDSRQQTDAMWAYFSLGEAMPTPPGIGRRQSMMLQVGERPRVFRTFLDSAGARGIAVGFPVGIHFAYDARRARLSEIWQGEFLDASGAWAGRGGNSRDAAGDVIWESEGQPTLIVGKRLSLFSSEQGVADVVKFQGYRLDEDGVPEFRYTQDGVEVRERNRPNRFPRMLVRSFQFSNLTPGVELWIRTDTEDVSAVVEGAREHGNQKSEDGQHWFRLVPDDKTCSVTLEVAL